MTSPASQLGKLSWKSRRKGKTKKQIAEMMQRVSKARLDKKGLSTSNA